MTRTRPRGLIQPCTRATLASLVSRWSLSTRASARRRDSPSASGPRRWLRCIAEIGLNLARQFDGQGPALAVARGTDRKAHPSFTDAVFLDVVSLHALEAH